jgi:hypothetical protein
MFVGHFGVAFAAKTAETPVPCNFGPPPSSPRAMAATALSFYGVMVALAAWVETFATSRPR